MKNVVTPNQSNQWKSSLPNEGVSDTLNFGDAAVVIKTEPGCEQELVIEALGNIDKPNTHVTDEMNMGVSDSPCIDNELTSDNIGEIADGGKVIEGRNSEVNLDFSTSGVQLKSAAAHDSLYLVDGPSGTQSSGNDSSDAMNWLDINCGTLGNALYQTDSSHQGTGKLSGLFIIM